MLGKRGEQAGVCPAQTSLPEFPGPTGGIGPKTLHASVQPCVSDLVPLSPITALVPKSGWGPWFAL